MTLSLVLKQLCSIKLALMFPFRYHCDKFALLKKSQWVINLQINVCDS